MKRLLFLILLTLSLTVSSADINLKTFAQNYYQAMVATQAPNATETALEEYLSLLHDDVGH